MNDFNQTMYNATKTAAIALMLTLSTSAFSVNNTQVIDSFDNTTSTNFGITRVFINDTTAGGKTTTQYDVTDGAIALKGEIIPPRGQPGWSSMVLPLSTTDSVYDASKYTGIRLTLKINEGSISISANSTDVTNYDYHAAQVAVPIDGKYHQVDIPFDSMKRMWSEQTALNRKTLNSLSVVAFGLKKSTFDFEINNVIFY